MKSFLSRFLCLLALGAALSASAATQKIGTVSFKRLFDNYYKTALAKGQYRELEMASNKQNDDWTNRLYTASIDYAKLLEEAKQQAISGEERAKRDRTASDKKEDIIRNQQAYETWARSVNANLTEQQQRLTQNIVKELKDALNAKARALGYTMVLDSSGNTDNAMPIVAFTSGDDDITDLVLADLNAKAPKSTDTNAPASVLEKKPEAVK